MTMIEKNLEALEKRFPSMAELIQEKKEELLEKENLEVLSERNLEGEEILKVRRNGRTLYLAGKRSAAGAAKKMVQFLGDIAYSAPVFIVGMGNIHYLEELFRVIPESSDNTIMIFEPSFSIFYAQLQRVDFEKLFGKRLVVLVVDGINNVNIKVLMNQMLNGDRVPYMKHFILPNYNEICLEATVEFQKKLKEQAEFYLTEENTRRMFSGVLVENLFKNARYVKEGYQAKQLLGIVKKDIPAILVSAGPSLNKNIDELKKAKNKAFIIAVDTAIKPLLAHGIVPDMYAIIDGKKPLNLVEVEESKEIPLIATVNAANAVLAYHTGKKFFFRQTFNFINKMYDMNKKEFAPMSSGGSVATMAFSLVTHLQVQTVIMVGQDLALTGNKTHADGTFKEKMEEEDTSKMKLVEGNVEDKVPTRQDFDHYRIWFEDYIEHWKKIYPEFRVINATEGGAKIAGTEIMSLKEAIEKECTKETSVSEDIAKLKPVFSAEEQEKIEEYLCDMPKQFHEIVMLAKAGRSLYKKLEKLTTNHNSDKTAYDKILKQIKKNTKKIEKNLNYQLIEDTLSRADSILKTSQYFEYQSFEDECKEIARRGIKFMELIEECATLFEKYSQEIFVKKKI